MIPSCSAEYAGLMCARSIPDADAAGLDAAMLRAWDAHRFLSRRRSATGRPEKADALIDVEAAASLAGYYMASGQLDAALYRLTQGDEAWIEYASRR